MEDNLSTVNGPSHTVPNMITQTINYIVFLILANVFENIYAKMCADHKRIQEEFL